MGMFEISWAIFCGFIYGFTVAKQWNKITDDVFVGQLAFVTLLCVGVPLGYDILTNPVVRHWGEAMLFLAWVYLLVGSVAALAGAVAYFIVHRTKRLTAH